MLRTLARFWAKLSYVWEQEVAAGKAEINANLSARTSAEKRNLVAQLSEKTSKYFRDQAATGRLVADKIRQL